MRSTRNWIIFYFLQLFSCISALFFTPNHENKKKMAVDNLPRPVLRRQYGNATASVVASMLSPAALYWHVTVLVNGQEMAVMVDTGSSDL